MVLSGLSVFCRSSVNHAISASLAFSMVLNLLEIARLSSLFMVGFVFPPAEVSAPVVSAAAVVSAVAFSIAAVSAAASPDSDSSSFTDSSSSSASFFFLSFLSLSSRASFTVSSPFAEKTR